MFESVGILSKKGQVLLPREILEFKGLKGRNAVLIKLDGPRIIIEPLSEP